MKVIEKYVDELSGREFKTKAECIKSEKKNGGIKKLFSFWKPTPEDQHCQFANGGWCYLRSEKDFLRLQDALIKAITVYEPWIAMRYEGGLRREHLKPGFILGRYLDDGDSELINQYRILSNICQVCFREWGQPYYANNCKHSETPRVIK